MKIEYHMDSPMIPRDQGDIHCAMRWEGEGEVVRRLTFRAEDGQTVAIELTFGETMLMMAEISNGRSPAGPPRKIPEIPGKGRK